VTAGRRAAVMGLVAGAAVLLAACQGRGGSGVPGTTRDTASGSAGATGFQNPVWPNNFPDPQVLPRPGGGYVAIATNGNGMNVQTLLSDDLVEWSQGSDAMPQLGEWTTPGKVWAPEAARFGDRWVVYYTTRAPDLEIQCIGRAVAEQPEGPYVDSHPGPLVCESDQGGSIDASPFLAADGKAYLYWKNDGNAVGVDTWISVQELAADGLSLVGKPKRLIQQDLPWEGHLVEAPYTWEHEGVFHLFYSANDYGSAAYAVGHATATSPLGPFTKEPEPVLVSTDVAAGPGHCALFEKDGQVWMAYHAWAPDAIGSEVPGRTMWLSRVEFEGTSVTVDPPVETVPQRP
jgi:beta-xylosidase